MRDLGSCFKGERDKWDGISEMEENCNCVSLILFSLLPTRCSHIPSRVELFSCFFFSHVFRLFCSQIALRISHRSWKSVTEVDIFAYGTARLICIFDRFLEN